MSCKVMENVITFSARLRYSVEMIQTSPWNFVVISLHFSCVCIKVWT